MVEVVHWGDSGGGRTTVVEAVRWGNGRGAKGILGARGCSSTKGGGTRRSARGCQRVPGERGEGPKGGPEGDRSRVWRLPEMASTGLLMPAAVGASFMQ